MAGGDATAAMWARAAVNYVVPFLVASAGWLSARRGTVAIGASPSSQGGPLGVNGDTAAADEEGRRLQQQTEPPRL